MIQLNTPTGIDKPSIGLCITSVLLQINSDPTFSAVSKWLTLIAVLTTILYNAVRIYKETKNK
jgi:hypothetical protein